MAKFAVFLFFAALVALSSAVGLGGIKDLAGNYYDFSTGQYSSAITGKVYNTAPVIPAPYVYAPQVAPVAPVAAPVAPVVSPYYYGAPYGAYPYGTYLSPLWKK